MTPRGVIFHYLCGMNESKLWRGIYWTTAIALSLLIGLLFLSGYPMADDLWFSMPGYESASSADRLFMSAEVVQRTVVTDMFRFGNLLAPLTIMALPRTVTALIYGMLCLMSIEGMRRVLRAGFDSWVTYGGIFLFFIALPWYDYLLATSYMLNYLLSSVLILWAIDLFLRDVREIGGVSEGQYAAGCVVAFFAGWCHEGFALPVVCGMGVAILLIWWKLRKFPLRLAGILLCVACGVAVIFAGATFKTRSAGMFEAVERMPGWEFAIQLGPSLAILTVTLLLSLPVLIRDFNRPRLLLLLTSAVAAECVAVAFYSGPRTGWPCVLYSMTALLSLPTEYGRFNKMSQRGVAFIAFAVLMSVGLHLLYAIRSQLRLSEEYTSVMREYAGSVSGEVYHDVTTPRVDLSLLKTSVRVLNDAHSLHFISLYEMGKDERKGELRILPSRLRGFLPELASSVSTGSDGYVYKDMAITGVNAGVPEEGGLIEVTTVDGKKSISRYRPIEFHDAAGRRYYWLMLHLQTISPETQIIDWELRE